MIESTVEGDDGTYILIYISQKNNWKIHQWNKLSGEADSLKNIHQ